MTYVSRSFAAAPARLPTIQPYHELSVPTAIVHALAWQAIGVFGLICHIVLVKEVSPACIVVCMAGLAWLASNKPLPAFVVFLQIVLYQNVLVSIFSPGMSHNSYVALSGSSFISAVVVAGAFSVDLLRSNDAQIKRLSQYAFAAIAVAAAYMAIGAAVQGPVGAIISFRSVSAMLFSLLIGLRLGSSWGYRTAATCFLLAVFVGLIMSALEIADPAWYLDLVNARDFFNLKNEGLLADRYLYDVHSVIETQTGVWFNSPLLSGGEDSFRFGGPNMHSISYAYVLSISELVLMSLGRFELVPVLLAFSISAGVKGATVLFAITTALYILWFLTRSKPLLITATLGFSAFYVIYGVRTGIEIGDFHALGFMGGVYGFLSNPLGHGLGAGGNLGTTVSKAYWEKMQHAGSADVGLESAVGVMLYQMGVGSVAIFAALVRLLQKAPFGTAPRPGAALTDLMFIGLWIGLVNGVFQEEAYSPYAVGLLVLFCAILAANGRRPAILNERLPG